MVVACYEVLPHLLQLGQPTRRIARIPTLSLHKLSLRVGPSMCHVPVMRTAPVPSLIPKGGRNHRQSRHSAHPPASTVTCLQAWGNASGQAGGLRVLSALRRDRDELLAAALLRVPRHNEQPLLDLNNSEYLPVWRRNRALSVDVSAIIFATTAQLRLQASAVDKVTLRELRLRVRRFSPAVITKPTSHTHFIRHRRHITSATGNAQHKIT